MDDRFGLLRRHESIGSDVRPDVEERASTFKQRLEEMHVVPVIHTLVVDQGGHAASAVPRDYSRLGDPLLEWEGAHETAEMPVRMLRETARKKKKLVERDVVAHVVEADTRERDR